jgi:hypothetical protein
VLAAALLALAPPSATPASAATYTVDTCDGGNGTGANNLFQRVGPWQDPCTAGIGLTSETRAGAAPLSPSGWQMAAPAGTTVAGFTLGYLAQWQGAGYAAQVDDGSAWLAGQCLAGLPCGWLSSPAPPTIASFGRAQLTRSGLSASKLRLITFCTSAGGCPSGFVRGFFSDIHVTLTDNSAPAVSYTGGELVSDSWRRGTQGVTYTASDNSGIRRTRLWVDDVLKTDSPRTCDYSKPVPCSGVDDAYAVNTSTLADGVHTFGVEARDATDSNSTRPNRSFFVDNHAPAPPVAVSVDGGQAPRSTRDWTVRWTNPPDQSAPIATANYRVCAAAATCTTGTHPVPATSGGSGQQATVTGDFGITQAGDYTVTLWLTDAAGNVDAANVSAPVQLRYDGGVPGRAQPRAPAGRWLDGAGATTYAVPIAMAQGAFVPASGVAGYAVTRDGSDPGTAIVASGAQASYGPPAGGWSNGTVRVRARAISGTGQASAEVGEAILHVDRLAPSASAEGQGAPGTWQPGPVTVRLLATDAAGGSGMGAADDGQPVEAGGHIAFSLDAAPLQKVAGDEAAVTVTGAGTHTVVFRAYDVAGNVSADRTITIGIGDPSDAPWPPPVGFWAKRSNPGATFAAATSFGGPCPAGATLTPNRDTYVDQADASARFGAAGSLLVRSGPGAAARALVGFAMPPTGGCAVLSARLRLHASSGAAGRTLVVQRLASSWAAADATWDTRPGAAGAGASVASPAGTGWVEVDVTEQVRAIYRHGDDGLVVRDAAEGATPTAGQVFDSSEAAPADRPQLVLAFG